MRFDIRGNQKFGKRANIRWISEGSLEVKERCDLMFVKVTCLKESGDTVDF